MVLTAGPVRSASAGDGEELLASFTERLLEAKRQLAAAGGGAAVPRRELLRALAAVPGVYVPQVWAGVMGIDGLHIRMCAIDPGLCMGQKDSQPCIHVPVTLAAAALWVH